MNRLPTVVSMYTVMSFSAALFMFMNILLYRCGPRQADLGWEPHLPGERNPLGQLRQGSAAEGSQNTGGQSNPRPEPRSCDQHVSLAVSNGHQLGATPGRAPVDAEGGPGGGSSREVRGQRVGHLRRVQGGPRTRNRGDRGVRRKRKLMQQFTQCLYFTTYLYILVTTKVHSWDSSMRKTLVV